MATTIRVRRISNPRHRPRKMSAKQIRFFGSKRQKAALRASRHRARSKANPPRRRRVVRVQRRRHAPRAKNSRKRSSNPALVVTLGSVANPRKKRRTNTVPATKRNRRRHRANVRHRPRRRRNGTFAARHRNRSMPMRTNRRRRRYNTRHYRVRRRNGPKIIVMKPNRRRSYRRRNPISTELFGQPLFGKNSLEIVAGAFGGLILAKFIPTLFPASITGGIASSSIGRVVISGIAAVVGAWAVSKISPAAGQGALLGGMVQTLSIGLNIFLPSAYASVSQYSTLGDLTAGAYPVPMNPILAGRPMASLPPAAASIAANGGGGQVRMTAGQSGVGRVYGPAY